MIFTILILENLNDLQICKNVRGIFLEVIEEIVIQSLLLASEFDKASFEEEKKF